MSAAAQIVAVTVNRWESPQRFRLTGPPSGPVVAPTRRGPFFGWVFAVEGPALHQEVPECRHALAEDLKQHAQRRLFAAEVARSARARGSELNLPLLILDATCSLDGESVVLFFGAEARLDFRVLARRLVEQYHKKIELRQLSARERDAGLWRLG